MEALVIEPDPPFRRQLVSALDTVGFATRVARDAATARRVLASGPTTVLYVAECLPDVPSGDLLADLAEDPLWAAVPIVLRAERPDSLFASVLTQAGQVVVTRESGALVIAELIRDGAMLRTPGDPRWPPPLLDRARQLRERAEDARNRSLALRARTAKLSDPFRKK